MLLGGTIFSMLEREGGPGAAAALATSPLDHHGPRAVIVNAFGRPLAGSSATGAPSWTRSAAS